MANTKQHDADHRAERIFTEGVDSGESALKDAIKSIKQFGRKGDK